MQTHIDLPFGDGEYTFRLGAGQIADLQRKCGWRDKDGNLRELGIAAINARLLTGRYVRDDEEVGRVEFGLPEAAQFTLADVVETIRLGLIGGGEGRVSGVDVKVSPMRANELIATYVVNAAGHLFMPLEAAWDLASAITMACVSGYKPKKKGDPAPVATKRPRRTPRAGSTTSDS